MMQTGIAYMFIHSYPERRCSLLPHRACARSGGIWPASADVRPEHRRASRPTAIPETRPLHGSTVGMGQINVRHHAK
jgi:hypothetical protein